MAEFQGSAGRNMVREKESVCVVCVLWFSLISSEVTTIQSWELLLMRLSDPPHLPEALPPNTTVRFSLCLLATSLWAWTPTWRDKLNSDHLQSWIQAVSLQSQAAPDHTRSELRLHSKSRSSSSSELDPQSSHWQFLQNGFSVIQCYYYYYFWMPSEF